MSFERVPAPFQTRERNTTDPFHATRVGGAEWAYAQRPECMGPGGQPSVAVRSRGRRGRMDSKESSTVVYSAYSTYTIVHTQYSPCPWAYREAGAEHCGEAADGARLCHLP